MRGNQPYTLDCLRELVAAVGADCPGAIDSEDEKARAQIRHRALLLLDHRSRSRHELTERLQQLDFSPGLVSDVLDDLQRTGLIDDRNFATEWVRQRHHRRGKSRALLENELRDKGVDAGIRVEALGQIAEADEQEMAMRLARKKARTTVPRIPEDRRARDKALRRILGVLARRGFPHEMSMEVADTALDERISELR
ncbi:MULTISPECIES: regulatory protein RecX [unclassified Corynebacterium]|uniref:regulatory protein RecX n=1 Tax=unclassified Corynebacterium TaxID=2624378 RepID=UPI00352612C1